MFLPFCFALWSKWIVLFQPKRKDCLSYWIWVLCTCATPFCSLPIRISLFVVQFVVPPLSSLAARPRHSWPSQGPRKYTKIALTEPSQPTLWAIPEDHLARRTCRMASRVNGSKHSGRSNWPLSSLEAGKLLLFFWLNIWIKFILFACKRTDLTKKFAPDLLDKPVFCCCSCLIMSLNLQFPRVFFCTKAIHFEY